MGLFGKIFKTGFDVISSPVQVAKDFIPGAGGYIDGNRSKTKERLRELIDDAGEVKDELEEL